MTPPGTGIKNVAILGAGAIGCYVGAQWSPALRNSRGTLTLIGRESTLRNLRDKSLQLTGDAYLHVDPDDMTLSIDAANLATADLIVLSMKATGLDAAIQDIQAHAKLGTPVISLLNGLDPVRQLRNQLPDHPIIAGMVPFNVVWRGDNHLHRSSAGELALERTPTTEAIAAMVAGTGVAVEVHADLQPVQYGKLLLNLINPINALSGAPLHAMLSQRAYRRVYAATLKEALAVYDNAGVVWQKVGPISPRLAVRLIQAPDFLFNTTLLKIQKIDKDSMTSMASDLRSGRPTEIDVINGEIVRLAEAAGTPAPINIRLVELIRSAETGIYPVPASAEKLSADLGL